MDVNLTVDKRLCISCGVCVSVCPERAVTLTNSDARGLLLPSIDESRCTHCSLCFDACPGIDADYTRFLQPSSDNRTPHEDGGPAGPYRSILTGRSGDKEIQYNGASGGIVSQILLHLLEEKLIDAAVTTKMGRYPKSLSRMPDGTNEALFGAPVVVTSRSDIIACQKSKYCPVPVGELMRDLIETNGRFAVVGLPCHLLAIRKMALITAELRERIACLLGLFCSRTPNFNATTHLLLREGIRPDDVTHLEYRSGGKNIGYMQIALRDGRTHRVPHLSFNYWGCMFKEFYMPRRCYLCPDKLAAPADISCGDNWSGTHDHEGGSSTAVVRTEKGQAIIDSMIDLGRMAAEPMSLSALVQSQGMDFKGNLAPRVRIAKALRRQVPDYGKIDVAGRRSMKPAQWPGELLLLFRSDISASSSRYYAVNVWGKALAIGGAVRTVLRKARTGLRLLGRFTRAFLPSTSEPVSKIKKHKIMIMGGYGGKDIGDEAMPHADLVKFEAALGDSLEVLMLSPDPAYTLIYHKQRSILEPGELGIGHAAGWRHLVTHGIAAAKGILFIMAAFLEKYGYRARLTGNLRSVLDELLSSDLLFNVGGGNLNSLTRQELSKKGFLYLAARVAGIPVVVSGQTIGPFTRVSDRLFARFVLNRVNLITFRDKGISHQRCLDIGVSGPLMKDAADDAISLPSVEKETAARLLEREVEPGWLTLPSDLTVCMNLKAGLKIYTEVGKGTDISSVVRLFALLADRILERHDSKILFLPTDYHPASDDREIHREVVSNMRDTTKVACIESEQNDVVLRGLLGLCDFALGARYHFCVFSAAEYLPCLGVAAGTYQMTKLRGLAALCNMPELYWEKDARNSDPEEIWSRLEDLLNKRAEISEKLKEIVPELVQASHYGVDFAVNILRETSQDGS